MTRHRTVRRRPVLLTVVLTVLAVLAPSASPARAATVASWPPLGPVYRPPVEGPIIDHFRPPACSWCPGNRGIDYAVPPGTLVRASAPGIVTFAGAIGAQRFVTVLHADGLRTSYAFLATVDVSAGQVVAQGDVVGTSGAAVHFGVRRGTVYLDPELLLAGWRPVPRLVPTDGTPPRTGAWDFVARAPPARVRAERAPIARDGERTARRPPSVIVSRAVLGSAAISCIDGVAMGRLVHENGCEPGRPIPACLRAERAGAEGAPK